jgi:hypothetical protein
MNFQVIFAPTANLPGYTEVRSAAVGLNNSGVAVSNHSLDRSGNSVTVPIVWGATSTVTVGVHFSVAINELGSVLLSDRRRTAIFRNGQFEQLPGLGGEVIASHLNDSDVVVGVGNFIRNGVAAGGRGIRWGIRGREMFETRSIPPPPQLGKSSCHSIGPDGTAVASDDVYYPNGARGTIYYLVDRTGVSTDLEPDVMPILINKAGVLASLKDSPCLPNTNDKLIVLGTGPARTNLGRVPREDGCQEFSIARFHESGWLTGLMKQSGGTNSERTVVFRHNAGIGFRLIPIPQFSGILAMDAADIDGQGRIVGRAEVGGNDSFGYIFDGYDVIDVNTLVTNSMQFKITSLNQISSQGIILGQGKWLNTGRVQACMLVP